MSFVAIILLILCLIAVRLFEDSLFYDPLIDYFKYQFHGVPLPELNSFLLIVSTTARYVLNSAISIGILYFLYKKRPYIKASLWIYAFALAILSPLFIILLQYESDFAKRALFYIRRFMIHPILLFVLVAGFYFLEQKGKRDVVNSL
jgi:exosortase F-associated protein